MYTKLHISKYQVEKNMICLIQITLNEFIFNALMYTLILFVLLLEFFFSIKIIIIIYIIFIKICNLNNFETTHIVYKSTLFCNKDKLVSF